MVSALLIMRCCEGEVEEVTTFLFSSLCSILFIGYEKVNLGAMIKLFLCAYRSRVRAVLMLAFG